MNTEKLNRVQKTLFELRFMADPCFRDRESVVMELRQLSALEKELSGNAESGPEQQLCRQIRDLVTDFVCVYLPVTR